jgi:hypothetical protein
MKTVITKEQKQELVNEILNGLQELIIKVIDSKFTIEEIEVERPKVNKPKVKNQSNFNKKLTIEEIQERCKIVHEQGYTVVNEIVLSPLGKVVRTPINKGIGIQFKLDGKQIVIPKQKFYIDYWNTLQENANIEEEKANIEEEKANIEEEKANIELSQEDRNKLFLDMLLQINTNKIALPDFTAEKPNSDNMTAKELTKDYGLIF